MRNQEAVEAAIKKSQEDLTLVPLARILPSGIYQVQSNSRNHLKTTLYRVLNRKVYPVPEGYYFKRDWLVLAGRSLISFPKRP